MLAGQFRMSSVDAKKLTAHVAARHGLLIREDDPAMALVTMSEMVLEQVLEKAEVGLRGILSDGSSLPQIQVSGDCCWSWVLLTSLCVVM